MSLPAWYKVIQPRADLRNGQERDTAEFAVHLDQVHHNQAPSYYQDPAQFFEGTYFTQNLITLGSQVVRRLAGETSNADAVFNLATQFGGGKTHSLTMLYHLATQGPQAEGWTGVSRVMDAANLRRLPQAKVAVFVGQQFDPRGGGDEPLRQTPWGEIAWQLAGAEGYKLFEPFDTEYRSPGGDTIGKLFALVNQPILILMDEIMNYFSRNRKSGLADQLYNFIQNLSEEARSQTRVALVVSIPASILEMNEQDSQDYTRVNKLVNRLGKAIMTSAETETSEIIRRRLFDWNLQALGANGRVSLDKKALATCQAYADWTVQHRFQLPPWFPVDNAFEAFQLAYPFHPAVLSVFERKWQALPLFQRTRGMLRLLALWVSQTFYQGMIDGKHAAPLITLGSAPLDNSFFRVATFEQLNEQKLETVVTTDIMGRKEAHAQRLDSLSPNKAIQAAKFHQSVASIIFFESNGGQTHHHATQADIKFAVGGPDIDIGHVDTVLEAMAPPTGSCFYLDAGQNNRYWFNIKPNLTKVLADRKANVNVNEINSRIQTTIRTVFSQSPGVKLNTEFFSGNEKLPHEPSLTLVVLSPEYNLTNPDTERLIETNIQEHGGTTRTYKSALLWSVANDDNGLKDAARKLLAWEMINEEHQSGTLPLDENQKAQLHGNFNIAREELENSVWRAYNSIILLDHTNKLRPIGFGPIQPTRNGTLKGLIINELKKSGELVESIGVGFLTKNWPPAFKEWPTQKVRDDFYASPQYPRLLNPSAIQEMIVKAVKDRMLGYVGPQVAGVYQPFHFGDNLTVNQIELSHERFIITKAQAEAYIDARKPRLTQLSLTPDVVTLKIDESQTFRLKGLDQYGNSIAVGMAAWSATGGDITPNGVFRSGQVAGTYTITATIDNIQAVATVTLYQQVNDEAEVYQPESKPDVLKQLTISPQNIRLETGQTQQFTAQGLTEQGQQIQISGVQWQASSGSINAQGLFTAGTMAESVTITAQAGAIQGTTQLTVKVKQAQALTWQGEVPRTKWVNFYSQVLAQFANDPSLKLTIQVELAPQDGVSPQKVEAMKAALRGLGLEDKVQVK